MPRYNQDGILEDDDSQNPYLQPQYPPPAPVPGPAPAPIVPEVGPPPQPVYPPLPTSPAEPGPVPVVGGQPPTGTQNLDQYQGGQQNYDDYFLGPGRENADSPAGNQTPGAPECPPGLFWNGTYCDKQCPPGQVWNGQWCSDYDPTAGLEEFTGGGSGGAGGGAGGDGGAGGARSTASSPIKMPSEFKLPPELQQFSDTLRAALTRMVTDPGTRYTPEVLGSIFGGLRSATEGNFASERRQIGEELASRGLSRSGIAPELIAQARLKADSDYTKKKAAVLINKAETDFQDRLAGLDRASQFLTQREAALLQYQRNSTDLSLGLSEIELSRLRIEQEREIAYATLRNRLQIAELGFAQDLLN